LEPREETHLLAFKLLVWGFATLFREKMNFFFWVCT
jgi:hypothetical protein